MTTCAVFATSNRPRVLSQAIGVLDRQTIRPSSIIISCVSDDDVEQDLRNSRSDIIVVTGERGLTKQRNRALKCIPPDATVVAFFDDDFIAHPEWIQAVESTLAANPDIAAVTGQVLADGINGSGYSFEQAWEFIVNCDGTPTEAINEPYSPYGCNMAFRRAALADIWFDERLVLYGWQEDRDFGAQVARRGRIVQSTLARGVHMGVKGGRVSGVRLGYSQIANPIYLNRKGTMRLGAVCEHIARNLVSNAVRSLNPEPYIDRRGRLKGNFIAARDLLRGRMSPEHAALL